MTPQEKAKDRRLRKQYGWTLVMYNALDRLQHHSCAGCGKPFKTVGNMDHKHFKLDIRKITRYSINGFEKEWGAEVAEYGILEFAKTKKAAIEAARAKALPLSVRGLLCPGRHGTGCNTKLGRIDDPVWLRSILRYLEDPPARKILQETK